MEMKDCELCVSASECQCVPKNTWQTGGGEERLGETERPGEEQNFKS